MRKKLLLLLVTAVLSFSIAAPIASAAGATGTNTMATANGNTTGMNNYGTNNTGGNYQTNAATDDNNFNWGWLGLAGLLGLTGLRGRNREKT